RMQSILLACYQTELRRGILMREARIQTPCRVQPDNFARPEQAVATLQVGSQRVREPGFGAVDDTREDWRHAHNGYRLAIEMHDLPDDLRVGSETISPQLLTQHDHRVRGRAVFRIQQPTQQRLFQVVKREEVGSDKEDTNLDRV